MKSATDYVPSLGFSVLLQGPPKTGKTILACKFPHPWIADCDNNLSPAIRYLASHDPEQLKQVKYDTININDDGSIVEPELRWARLIKCTNAAIKDPEIETIVLDKLGFFAQYIMDHIVASKSGDKKAGMTISDWIPFRELLGKFITGVRASRKLVIVTADDEVNKDEVTGQFMVTPSLPSKMAGTIGGYFSDVWHTESEEDLAAKVMRYKIRCAPRPTIPSLGNSLGLPMEFQFDWKSFSAVLYGSGLYKPSTKK